MSKSTPLDVPLIRDKRQKAFSLALIFVVGTLLVGVASLIGDSFFRTLLASIGSVIIAFGLTSLISQVFSPAPFEGVLRMINELLVVPWRSKEEELVPLRKLYYGYLYSMREGKPVWIYRDFDFGNLELPGYLHAAVQYSNGYGADVKYKYYGFPVQSRMLLIGRNADLANEPAVIQMIPHCGQSGIYAGLALFEAVSGEQVVTPTILSSRKLVSTNQCGILDPQHFKELTRIWRANFKSVFLLPDDKSLFMGPGEQAGTGQPATRPESKSEGSDKPQPESEGRSQ